MNSLTLFILLAQVTPQIPTEASTAQAITGGSLALNTILGGVLTWLLWVYLPTKDKQLDTMIVRHNTDVKDLIAGYNKIIEGKDDRLERKLTGQQATFEKSLQSIVEHCREESESMRAFAEMKMRPSSETHRT